ncbi:MAG: hypothetical protein WC866_02030 [Patescibacteria group bacterium]
MKKFFHWMWEGLNLLSQALKWMHGHPKHVFVGLLVIVVLLTALPAHRCGNHGAVAPPGARPLGGPPPIIEQRSVTPRRMPPPPVPKDYTDDPGAAIRDLEALGH